MRYLNGEEEKEAIGCINEAAKAAERSCCLRARCGSVIVNEGKVIGTGFNSPPGDQPLEKCLKDNLPASFKSDKTCCVHAEQRAMIDALIKNPAKLRDSRIYFIRLAKDGSKEPEGKPDCTICGKLALELEIKDFVFWHKQGICAYGTREYNELSFQYTE